MFKFEGKCKKKKNRLELFTVFDENYLLSFLCRTYGRAPKMIHLEANFVQFKEELLPKEGNKALLTFPFLHIYWTDCCVSSSKNIIF